MVVVAVVVAVRRNNGTRNGWMYGGRTDRHTRRDGGRAALYRCRREASTAALSLLLAASWLVARRSRGVLSCAL